MKRRNRFYKELPDTFRFMLDYNKPDKPMPLTVLTNIRVIFSPFKIDSKFKKVATLIGFY